MTRHLTLSEESIWERGEEVARLREIPLFARADISAQGVRICQLDICSAPVKGNPEHADITGWPESKESQKTKAQELAILASFVAKPV